jgi:hypothetical protein
MRLDDAIGVITATGPMGGHGRGGIAASTSVGAPRIMPGSGTPTQRLVRGGIDRQSDHQDASTPTAQRRSVKPT